jgi:hypothetical protein
MSVEVHADDLGAERGADMSEAPVLEWMIDVETRVVRPIVSIPMVIVDVWTGVRSPALHSFALVLCSGIGPGCGRWWYAAPVCVGDGVLSGRFVPLLSESRSAKNSAVLNISPNDFFVNISS